MEYQFIISGEIGVSYDWWTGQKGTTAKEVRTFLNNHKDEEVHIAVSSPGGYVDAGLEIYQYIKDHGKVHMHILGMTASAATFLTMGAKSVDMVDGSLMLIHNASTSVMEWQKANKQQLDTLIEKFQKERDDLDTIDKVIASLYANKSGKTVDECMKKMDEEKWLSPQDALDFGLIDCIRKDEEDTTRTKNLRQFFSNHYNKELGLPPLPTQNNAQGNGGPTKSIFRKTADAVKSMFHNEPALNENNQMIKIFLNVAGLLAITDGFKTQDDGSIALSQEQLKTVDDRLGALEKEVTDERKAKDELQKQLDEANKKLKKAQEDLTTANETIKNIKGAAGDDTKNQPADTNTFEDDDMKFIENARASYERIKDI